MRYILTIAIISLACWRSFAQLSLSLPISGVYQTTGANTSVVLAGQYTGPSLANYRIEYKVERLKVTDGSFSSLVTGYTSIATNPQYGLYRYTMSLPVGWYAVEVRIWDINAGTALSYTYRQKFGVGDVYLIAGQSNAQGNPDNGGAWSLPSISAFDGVVSHNYWGPCNANLPPYPSMSPLSGYNRIAPSGNNSWNWAHMGQQLSGGSSSVPGTPIAFFNAAAGGSSSVNWKESASGVNSNHDYTGVKWCGTGYGGPAQPYYDFQTMLKYYASIFGAKAVLWHQGEADNNKEKNRLTTRTAYRDNIDYVIDKSRSDYSSSLRWFVSEATFNGKNPTLPSPNSSPATRTDVIDGQKDLAITPIDGTVNTATDMTYTGSQTDSYAGAYRDLTDLVHFREDRSTALTTLGNAWKLKIASPSGPLANIPAEVPPVVTMSKSGSNWTLSVSGSYSEYRWLNMWSPDPNAPVGTSWSLSGSSSFGAWACLVKNSAGKWAISQTFYTSCGVCRSGEESVSEFNEKDYGIDVKAYPMPFDKNLTIEFSIPNQSQVCLELIGSGGQILNKLTNNIHEKGTYKYPVSKAYLHSGVSFYRLNINGLAITKKLLKAE